MLRQCRTLSDGRRVLVPDHCRRFVPVAPTQQSTPPGKIGILAVEKESFVEQACVSEIGRPQQDSRPGPSKDLRRPLVLASIDLEISTIRDSAVGVKACAGIVQDVDGWSRALYRQPPRSFVDHEGGFAAIRRDRHLDPSQCADEPELEAFELVAPRGHVELTMTVGPCEATELAVRLPTPESRPQLRRVQHLYTVYAGSAELYSELPSVPGHARSTCAAGQ